jgi:hypothetical protein
MAMKEFDSYVYSGTDPGKQGVDDAAADVSDQTKINHPSKAAQIVAGGAAILDYMTPGSGSSRMGTMGKANDIKALDSVVASAGTKGIEVLDGSGKVIPMNMNDNDFAKKMSEGTYKVRATGDTSGGQSLTDIASHGGQLSGGGGGGSANVTGQLTVTVDQQGRIGVSPNPVPLQGNKVNANGGAGTASANDPGLH